MSHFDLQAATWDADPIKQERALAVARALRQQVPLSPTWWALEYGCGTGLLSFALHTDLGSMTLADAAPGMLAVLETKIAEAGLTHLHPLLLDLTRGPLPTERYDLIHTLMTLHHVADTDRLLRDFHALLRPGGWLAIADLDWEDGSFHGPGFTGHCGFDRTSLGEQIKAAGFDNVAFSTCYVMHKPTDQGSVNIRCFWLWRPDFSGLRLDGFHQALLHESPRSMPSRRWLLYDGDPIRR